MPAAVDMTGTFYLEFPPTLCTMNFFQSGTALSVDGCGLTAPVDGMIDTATGAFVLDVDDPFCGDLQGTATNGGADFTAQFTSLSHFQCFVMFVGSRHCHNGVIDAGESCDPGAVVEECCPRCTLPPPFTPCGSGSPECTFKVCATGTCRQFNSPTDSGCTADANQCTNDVCDGHGSCTHVPVPGLGCSDGDGCTGPDTCDADGVCRSGPGCEPCTVCGPGGSCSTLGAIASGCDGPTRSGSPLALKQGSSDARDRASWTLTHGPSTPASAFGDPVADTSYTFCVYTSPVGSADLYTDTLLGLVLPGGATCANGQPCWKASKHGFRYRDRSAARGVTRLDLRAGDDGRARLSLKGKGPQLGVPSLPTTLPVLVQLTADDGRCWQVEYTDARANDPSVFRADGAARGGE